MNVPQAQTSHVPGAIRKRCVYCLGNGELSDGQVLLRGRHLYLCAPRGQLVEGYLVIAPLTCTGSLSAFPAGWSAELNILKGVVLAFYREAYGATDATLYEQGRAGGGARFDEAGGFPHHAHLCCLPLAVDLHALLAPRHVRLSLSGPEELSSVVPDRPYVYIEGGAGRCCVYVPATDEGRQELERIRLKPAIAALLGLPDRGDWRAYPGDRELASLIRRFGAFRKEITLLGECYG